VALLSGAVTAELQFTQLSWTEFEELIAALAEVSDDLVDVRRYGPDGQAQDGIDVIGFTRTSRRAYAYQCKRVSRFTESHLERAVAEFIDGARPFDPVKFVVAVAVPALRTQVLHLLEAERGRHPEVDLQLWDAPRLNDLLRDRPRIVERFFGEPLARAFCVSDSFSPAASPDDECPYPGLAPFQSDQARWFSGRQRAVAEICQRMDGLLAAAGPLVVTGPSGVGKSSLLRAGVVPAIREGRLPVTWPLVLMTPTDRPMRELTERMSTATDGDGPQRAVLLVDQFEEVFTLCADEDEQTRFIDEIARLSDHPASGPGPSALVVLCLRADFYGQCLAYEPLRVALRANAVPLGPMSAGELREAITAPAEAAGLRVEPGLPDLLLRDVGLPDSTGDQAERLPLMAHALRATWQQRQGRYLTVEGYRMTGGISEAVASTAERTYAELDTDRQRLAKTLFTRLVKVGDGTVDVCRPAGRDELLRDLADSAGTADIMRRFTDARLLTQQRDTVTIAHEALLRCWPRLGGWIADSRADNLTGQRLHEAAAAWARDDSDDSALYGGKRLAAARAWASEHKADLGASAASFLSASNQRQRKLRAAFLAVGVITAVLAVAVATTVTIAIGEHDAATRKNDQAAYNAAMTEATQVAPHDPQLAAQLYLAAYRMRPSPAVAARLLATQHTPFYTVLPVTAHAVAFSPNSSVFATGGDFIQLWQTTGPGHARSLSRPFGGVPGNSGPGVEAMAFSPDRRTLAVIVNDLVRLWDVSDPAHPRSLGVLTNHGPGPAQAVTFGPVGGLLAVGTGSGMLGATQLWDVSDPAHPQVLGPALAERWGPVDSAAFSPNGRTLATGDSGGYVQQWNMTRPASAVAIGEPLPVDTGTSSIDSLAYALDGATLAAGSSDGGVLLWDVANPARAHALGAALTGCAPGQGSAAFGPHGLLAAGCGAGGDSRGSVRLWHVTAGALPAALTLPQSVDVQVKTLAVSADGRTLVVEGWPGTVTLWSIPQVMLNDGQVLALAFSPQRGILASAGSGGTVRLWMTNGTGAPRPLGTLRDLGRGFFDALALSPDGRLLAGGDGGRVRLWPLADSGRSFLLPSGDSVPGNTLAISPDDGLLAVCDGQGDVQMWDVSDPVHAHQVSMMSGDASQCSAVAFSADGGTLAIGGDDSNVYLWRVSDPAHPRPLGAPLPASDTAIGGIVSLAFSPHDHLLASGAADGTVRLWRVAGSARPVAVGRSLNDPVGGNVAVAFNAHGTVLAVGGNNDSVQLLDVTDPANPRPVGPPLTVAADPASTENEWQGIPTQLVLAGDTAITGSTTDGATLLWTVNVSDAISRICAIPGQLTPAQWQRYIPQVAYATDC
jgi:WD40 repeat protein